MELRAREGDFIETIDNLIFDVKGLVHPPDRVIAFIRYFPDPTGNRKRNGIVYRKVYSFIDRYRLLEENFSNYLIFDPVFNERLQAVPTTKIKNHYKPSECLRRLKSEESLDEAERQSLDFVDLLHEYSDVPFSNLGISGSMLVDLHIPESDIDLIVYGTEHCLRIREALMALLRNNRSKFKNYDIEDLKRLYNFRVQDTKMLFKDFVKHESRKTIQGKFMGRDYFVRYIKDWDELDEVYGDIVYESLGYVKIQAQITDDTESIFTPCHYKINKVKINKTIKSDHLTEVVSYRGRFCEQAKKGEYIVAQGKLEKVKRKDEVHHRILLGNQPSDLMVTIDKRLKQELN